MKKSVKNKIYGNTFIHNLSPRAFLYKNVFDDVVSLQTAVHPKPKKVPQNDFNILKYDEYDLILKNNYNCFQLRMMCKKYRQRVSGNKNQLKYLLYNYLKYSFFSIKIQNAFKRFLVNKYNKLKGPGVIKRGLCVNETDFLTLEKIKNIQYDQFISFKDQKNFIYGFNICSITNLLSQHRSKLKNPYNREKFPDQFKKSVGEILRIGKLLKIKTNVNFNKNVEEISHASRIKFKTIEIFTHIDNFGFVTNIKWFLDLSRLRLCKLIKELYDVWSYRLEIPMSQKIKICPNGSPFGGFVPHRYINKPLHVLQNRILNILTNFITSGVDEESRKLGSYYVLGCLTLVSGDAADSQPWLYGAFVY
jgi:hypothetical protein